MDLGNIPPGWRHLFSNEASGRVPDFALLTDLAKKCLEDVVDAMRRNAQYTNSATEASILMFIVIHAAMDWLREGVNKQSDESPVRKVWDMVEDHFRNKQK